MIVYWVVSSLYYIILPENGWFLELPPAAVVAGFGSQSVPTRLRWLPFSFVVTPADRLFSWDCYFPIWGWLLWLGKLLFFMTWTIFLEKARLFLFNYLSSVSLSFKLPFINFCNLLRISHNEECEIPTQWLSVLISLGLFPYQPMIPHETASSALANILSSCIFIQAVNTFLIFPSALQSFRETTSH